jgi:hypothetical protein
MVIGGSFERNVEFSFDDILTFVFTDVELIKDFDFLGGFGFGELPG